MKAVANIVAKMRADLAAVGGFENGMLGVPAEGVRTHIEALEAALREVEPVARFCPGCGSVGPVPEQYRDCCPDGNKARMIPESLAHNCRDLFRLALLAPSDPDEIAAAPSHAPRPAALDWQELPGHVSSAVLSLAQHEARVASAAPQPAQDGGEVVAWEGPSGQLMPHVIFEAWREQYPGQGHEHFRPLVRPTTKPAAAEAGVVEALRKAVEALETVEVHDGEVHRVVHLVHYATEGGKAALAALAAQPQREPAGAVEALPEFDDKRVQAVYGVLCDTDLIPPPEEHWEGFIARHIVAALAAQPEGRP